jgi:hypothetical protein
VSVAEIARYPASVSAASANGTSSALDGDRSAVVAVVHPGVCASWVTRAETPPLYPGTRGTASSAWVAVSRPVG